MTKNYICRRAISVGSGDGSFDFECGQTYSFHICSDRAVIELYKPNGEKTYEAIEIGTFRVCFAAA